MVGSTDLGTTADARPVPDDAGRPAESGTRPGRPGAHIPELHGLRGLALALVVAFHLFGNGRVSGGVDVFLVVSGFLATGSLLRRADARTLRLGEHYGRTFSRLVPPALVVLVATAALTWWLMPRGTWIQTGRELIASATYWVNWELISGQLAYGAAGPQTSPLQHFWSMSVQGQFFLAWPLVVLVVAGLARVARLSARWTLFAGTATATVASFLFALELHELDQPVAYFHSWARFWELGAGGLLALLLPSVRLPHRLRPLLAWGGLGLVVACGFVLDGGAEFPGPWTLWPVLGTFLVLLGSGGRATWGPRRLLELRPLRFVADVSYALYLWHWPLLIAYLHATGLERIRWFDAVGIMAASTALAWLTGKLVADPAQRFRVAFGGVRSLVASGVAVALVAGGAVAVVTALERQEAAQLAEATQAADDAVGQQSGPLKYPGALALGKNYGDPVPKLPVVPAPFVAEEDRPAVDDDGCIQGNGESDPDTVEPLLCTLSDPADPRQTVVLVGDSHSIQWAPAMERVGRSEGWRVLLLAKRGCRLALELGEPQENETCLAWNRNAMALLKQMRPDAVMLVGSRTSTVGPGDHTSPPEVAAWRELADVGIRTVTVRDSPRFEFRVPECVEEHPGGKECFRLRADALSPVSPPLTAQGVPASAAHVDMTPWICGEVRCNAIVGNVLVYRDDDHLSGTYASTLADPLRDQLRRHARWLFREPFEKPTVLRF
jgi:peptidoglycan/LPS O-acetylase OafA/YrhL